MASESIDKLAKLLAETVPAGLRSAREDLESNFRAVLKSSIGKLDLVTREEFDVQQAVLARTREKLEAIEAKLKSMETETAPAPKKAKKKASKKSAAKKPAKKKAAK